MFCEVATVLGWDWQTIRATRFRDLGRLFVHWRENPPPALLIRAFLMGKQSKPKRPTRENTRNPFADD